VDKAGDELHAVDAGLELEPEVVQRQAPALPLALCRAARQVFSRNNSARRVGHTI
jgi:hypothetical protein